jgi:hypothetical protein
VLNRRVVNLCTERDEGGEAARGHPARGDEGELGLAIQCLVGAVDDKQGTATDTDGLSVRGDHSSDSTKAV